MKQGGHLPVLRVAILALGLAGAATNGPGQSASFIASKSHSGQFILVAAPGPLEFSRTDPRLERTKSSIDLDPSVLPIACERIKQAVGRQLGTGSGWQGRIYLALHPAAPGESGSVVASERFNDAWQYRVELPTPADGTLFIRSIVQALLTEMGNRRNSGSMTADVPAWLVEGLTQEIRSIHEAELILSAPTTGTTPVSFSPKVKSTKEHPLRQVHNLLVATPALSFDRLSWPTPDDMAGNSAVFSASAHLFFSRLGQLPNGRACLKRFVESLSGSQNWQFAFFQSFGEHFKTPVQAEKWWSLQVVHFTGREVNQGWPLTESCKNLRLALQIPVKVHESTNALPSESSITLQKGLQQWRGMDHTSAIAQKARELEMIRMRVSPELAGLVDEYRRVIEAWVERDARNGLLLGVGKKFLRNRATDHAVARLNELDKRLSDMHKAPQS